MDNAIWLSSKKNAQVKRALVTGISGTGKSTLVKHYIRNCNRLIIHDVLGEWGDSCLVCESWDEVYSNVKLPRFRLAVQVDDDAYEAAEHIARIARCDDVGDCVVVFEELSIAFGQNRFAGPYLQKLVRLGRRENVSAIFVTQRAYDCPIDLRSQMTHVIAFHSIEPRDIEYIGRIVGKKEAEKILALRGHQYLYWDMTTNTVPDAKETENEPQIGGDRGRDRSGYDHVREQQQRNESVCNDERLNGEDVE